MGDPLVCAFCMYLTTGEANPALTVMGGDAVCDDHLGLARSAQVTTAIQLQRERP